MSNNYYLENWPEVLKSADEAEEKARKYATLAIIIGKIIPTLIAEVATSPTKSANVLISNDGKHILVCRGREQYVQYVLFSDAEANCDYELCRKLLKRNHFKITKEDIVKKDTKMASSILRYFNYKLPCKDVAYYKRIEVTN